MGIIVVVNDPLGREIYVNGDYEAPRAISLEDIPLKAGTHKFETLTADRKVDFRRQLVDVPDRTRRVIGLNPVEPAEPIAPPPRQPPQ